MLRKRRDGEARMLKRFEHCGRTRGRVEAYGVTCAAAASGIIREHQRNPKIPRRRGAKFGPARGEGRDVGDAVLVGLVALQCDFEFGIADAFRLVRDRTRQDAAVEFRQHDVHGHVGRREATWRCLPRGACASRKHDLKHGQSAASRTVEPSSRAAEKAVALRMTAGFTCASKAPMSGLRSHP